MNEIIEHVLDGKEISRGPEAGVAGEIAGQCFNISARAKRSVQVGMDDDAGDVFLASPSEQLFVHGAEHF